MFMANAPLDRWIERAFIGLCSVVSFYVAAKLSELVVSVQELNLKMAVFVQKDDTQQTYILDHENRIRLLESRLKQGG